MVNIGSTGLEQSGGYLMDERFEKLRGSRKAEFFKKMSETAIIGGVQGLIETLIGQVDWSIKAADKSPEALKWADFVDSALLKDMDHSFDDFVQESARFLVFGWSFFEIIYKVRRAGKYTDGKLGIADIAPRSQLALDHWEINPDGKTTGMWQNDQYNTKGYVFMPVDKAVHLTFRPANRSPEGQSLYRPAVRDYLYHEAFCNIGAIGVERDLTGIPVMQVPPKILSSDASDSDKALRAAFEAMLAGIKNDDQAYALIPSEMDQDGKPSGFKLSLLSTGGTRAFDLVKFERYHKTNMLQSVMAQFLDLGMNSLGSFALASSQTNLFTLAVAAILKKLKDQYQKQIVDRLCRINGCQEEYFPTVMHGDIESTPLKELGDYVKVLAESGQLPDDPDLREWFLRAASMPVSEMKLPTLPPTKGATNDSADKPSDSTNSTDDADTDDEDKIEEDKDE